MRRFCKQSENKLFELTVISIYIDWQALQAFYTDVTTSSSAMRAYAQPEVGNSVLVWSYLREYLFNLPFSLFKLLFYSRYFYTIKRDLTPFCKVLFKHYNAL